MSSKKRGDGTTRASFAIPTTDADVLRAAIEGTNAPRRSNLNAAALGMEVGDFNALPRDHMGHASFCHACWMVSFDQHWWTALLLIAGGISVYVAWWQLFRWHKRNDRNGKPYSRWAEFSRWSVVGAFVLPFFLDRLRNVPTGAPVDRIDWVTTALFAGAMASWALSERARSTRPSSASHVNAP